MRTRVARGVAWKVTSGSTVQLLRIAVGIILARLLTPDEYGVAGMVIVFSTLVLVFSDLAFGAALIQRKLLTEDDRSTVFWTSVAAGALFSVVGVALAGPLADFYGEPQVKPLFAAMSVTFVVTALASTQVALLTREMQFRTLELRKMVGGLASGVAAITIALAGYGAWAIIGQQIALAVASTALLWASSPWRPHFRYSVKSLRSLGGYSANVFGSRLLFYANRNADNLLIGRFIGAPALGAYAVAYNVMLIPISEIAIPVQDVLFPAFSRLQDNVAAMRDAWLRVNRVIAAVTMPALLGLIAVAPDFVHVVLGDRWSPAIRVIQILAWVGLLQSLQGLNSSILRAVDRTKTLFHYSLIVVAASLAAFAGGLHWGIVGVATAYAISSTIVEPIYTWMTVRSVGLTLLDFARPLAGVAQASLAMFVVVVGARVALVEAGAGPALRLGLLILLGGLVYAAMCAWRAPAVVDEIRIVVRRRRARRRARDDEPL